MAAQLAKLSYKHDEVLDCILANPHVTLGQLSQLTGYTVPWLSQLINNDLFQAAYATRRGEVVAPIIATIQEKLTALGHMAVEKLAAKVAVSEDPEFLLDAFDKTMHRLGYAPKTSNAPGPAPVVQQNNVFMLDKGFLAQVRQPLVNGQQGLAPTPQVQAAAPVTEGTVIDVLPSPAELQAG